MDDEMINPKKIIKERQKQLMRGDIKVTGNSENSKVFYT